MKLVAPNGPLIGEVQLPISKSIANRYLIISKLTGSQFELPEALPVDVRILRDSLASSETIIDIGMAGTAMRFLAAFYAVQKGKEIILSGDARMQQRPIGELADILSQLGAEIAWLEEIGFPPLRIRGQKLHGGNVEISASISSQFISALMMIAPTMENGLEIKLKGKILSRPYIELTANCMRLCGIEVQFVKDVISISKGEYQIPNLNVEADWSAASYFYAMAASKPNSKLLLKGLNLNSPQGDRIMAEWSKGLGVTSTQVENGVEISSTGIIDFPRELDFTNNPDLAQTFAFLAAALGKELKLTGLDNLKFKETDRITAIQTELQKLGLTVSISGNSLQTRETISSVKAIIKTYNDHRMAMSAAILSCFVGAHGNPHAIEIENPKVVEKSFPNFWGVLNGIGFE